MLGIRGKSKKASKADSPKKEDPLTNKKSTKKTRRRISLNCLNNRVKDDQSEVHMVHIDHFASRSPPSKETTSPSNDTASKTTKTIKISNMMTPDMLEALGIEEGMHVRPRRSAAKLSKEKQELYDITDANHSVSTSSTCSSHDSLGPLPVDPFLDSCNLYENCNQDDWNLLESHIDNKALLEYYRDNSLAGCTPMTCAGVALSMPVACGLLCVDNVLDTNLFETATKEVDNETSNDDKPEVLTIKDKKRAERRIKTISSPVASL